LVLVQQRLLLCNLALKRRDLTYFGRVAVVAHIVECRSE
jgi:hypothetical protein